MELLPRSELLVIALFGGLLAHMRWAYRAATTNEGPFWLWSTSPKTTVDRLARYSLFVWVGSCLVILLPIKLEVAVGIETAVLLAHLMVFEFRSS